MADFNRLTETYDLKVNYILHPEAILMGNEAKVLIKTELTVNDRVCDLKLLKNTKIKLTTTSFIDNIPVTKTFENFEIKNEEIELVF